MLKPEYRTLSKDKQLNTKACSLLQEIIFQSPVYNNLTVTSDSLTPLVHTKGPVFRALENNNTERLILNYILIRWQGLWYLRPRKILWVNLIWPRRPWILRARDRDRDILARLRFGHRRPVNRGCLTKNTSMKTITITITDWLDLPGAPAWTPATSKSRVSNERKKSYFSQFFHLFAK